MLYTEIFIEIITEFATEIVIASWIASGTVHVGRKVLSGPKRRTWSEHPAPADV